LIPLSRSIACTQIDTVSGDICCPIIRKRNISVHVYDIKPHTKMIAKISKCSEFTIVTNRRGGEIMAQQISHDTVSTTTSIFKISCNWLGIA
jgi:hypothetical protein